jgi:hypothetical protein
VPLVSDGRIASPLAVAPTRFALLPRRRRAAAAEEGDKCRPWSFDLSGEQRISPHSGVVARCCCSESDVRFCEKMLDDVKAWEKVGEQRAAVGGDFWRVAGES